jgi:hypothetical protein
MEMLAPESQMIGALFVAVLRACRIRAGACNAIRTVAVQTKLTGEMSL